MSGHDADGAGALEVAGPRVEDAHLAGGEAELRKPFLGLLRRQHGDLGAAVQQEIRADPHRAAGAEVVDRAQAPDLVVETLSRPLLPGLPLHRCPFRQLDVGLVVAGVPHAAYPLGHIRGACRGVRDIPLLEHRHLVSPVGRLDGRRQAEHPRPDYPDAHALPSLALIRRSLVRRPRRSPEVARRQPARSRSSGVRWISIGAAGPSYRGMSGAILASASGGHSACLRCISLW